MALQTSTQTPVPIGRLGGALLGNSENDHVMPTICMCCFNKITGKGFEK
jgi:hypothetical protein